MKNLYKKPDFIIDTIISKVLLASTDIPDIDPDCDDIY